jgi:hypothetical protein
MTEIAQTFWLLFSTVKVLRIFLTKNVFGNFLCDSFTNSSGHPASDKHPSSCVGLHAADNAGEKVVKGIFGGKKQIEIQSNR